MYNNDHSIYIALYALKGKSLLSHKEGKSGRMLNFTNLSVAEAMNSDYGRVGFNTTIDNVLDLMLENQWSEVIVVDETGDEHSLITREHIVKKVQEGVSITAPIKEICLKKVLTIDPETELTTARDFMRIHKIGRLPVKDDSGQVIGILTARDVCNGFSGRLETLGNHMFSVIENIVEAVQVINCDGIVTLWNQQAEKLFDIKADDIIGKQLSDFFPDDLLLEVIKTEQSYSFIPTELEDGSFAIRSAVPVFLPEGQMVGAVCTTQNISYYQKLMDELEKANSKVLTLRKAIANREEDDGGFYTINRKTRLVLEQAKKVAKTNATVLIQGESGTGKELMAHVLYENSDRADKPFIEVNCSAIPETLFESEMFGYESGAFTGAQKYGKLGKFELAQGGTIFLDEVGELPLDMQAKLLRVLQEKRFYRVGGTTPINCDVRVIAATNQELLELVEAGKFRDDLFYRLNVVNLVIPPLRERQDDILGLTNRFLRELALAYNRNITGMDEKFIEILTNFYWPGNVRQLHNLLERIVILTDHEVMTRESIEEVGVLDLLLSSSDNDTGGREVASVITSTGENISTSLDEIVLQREREVIIKALEKCRNNKAQTAKMLGIPRSTLYYKLKTLDIIC